MTIPSSNYKIFKNASRIYVMNFPFFSSGCYVICKNALIISLTTFSFTKISTPSLELTILQIAKPQISL